MEDGDKGRCDHLRENVSRERRRKRMRSLITDHPVELVEQLQIRLPVENKTLNRKVKHMRSFLIWKNIDPVRIEDKDGSEKEDEEGGWSVDKSHRCPSLQFDI